MVRRLDKCFPESLYCDNDFNNCFSKNCQNNKCQPKRMVILVYLSVLYSTFMIFPSITKLLDSIIATLPKPGDVSKSSQ